MFFPTLLAGPIVRANETIPQFHLQTNPDLKRFTRGALTIAGGLCKKVFIADIAAQYVNQVFANPAAFSGATRLVAAYGFTLQIYCDFSGYSDVAIGTGVLFGYELMENFRYPYLAASLREFWRRWHISLSTWLRDYLYISLGGNRHGRFRGYLALFLTMLLGGLWHGANYTFLIWGGLHGLALALERWGMSRGVIREPATAFSRAVRILICFHVVALLWVFFRADTISAAFAVIAGIFSWSAGQELGVYPIYLLLAFMGYEILSRQKSIIPTLMRRPLVARWAVYVIVFLLISIFAGSRSQEFIYFKF
jgi:D-alanyl-lipoteichoic acid acyltransferase DltB (MBOAT superfamily)